VVDPHGGPPDMPPRPAGHGSRAACTVGGGRAVHRAGGPLQARWPGRWAGGLRPSPSVLAALALSYDREHPPAGVIALAHRGR
jgi:hypothetical protein